MLEPHEVAYLIKKCENDRAVYVRACDNSISHAAIEARDRYARQIELLDIIIAKLQTMTT